MCVDDMRAILSCCFTSHSFYNIFQLVHAEHCLMYALVEALGKRKI